MATVYFGAFLIFFGAADIRSPYSAASQRTVLAEDAVVTAPQWMAEIGANTSTALGRSFRRLDEHPRGHRSSIMRSDLLDVGPVKLIPWPTKKEKLKAVAFPYIYSQMFTIGNPKPGRQARKQHSAMSVRRHRGQPRQDGATDAVAADAAWDGEDGEEGDGDDWEDGAWDGAAWDDAAVAAPPKGKPRRKGGGQPKGKPKGGPKGKGKDTARRWLRSRGKGKDRPQATVQAWRGRKRGPRARNRAPRRPKSRGEVKSEEVDNEGDEAIGAEPCGAEAADGAASAPALCDEAQPPPGYQPRRDSSEDSL